MRCISDSRASGSGCSGCTSLIAGPLMVTGGGGGGGLDSVEWWNGLSTFLFACLSILTTRIIFSVPAFIFSCVCVFFVVCCVCVFFFANFNTTTDREQSRQTKEKKLNHSTIALFHYSHSTESRHPGHGAWHLTQTARNQNHPSHDKESGIPLL